MFPWERRQMEGGELKPWEKMYWGVFVVAIALLLFNRLKDGREPEEPQVRLWAVAAAVGGVPTLGGALSGRTASLRAYREPFLSAAAAGRPVLQPPPPSPPPAAL